MQRALFCFLLLASPLWASPPALEIEPEVHPTGQYVRMVPKTDAIAVTYVGLDGLDPIPSDLLKDGRLFLLDSRGLAVGRYRFAAVAASRTGEQARADFVVVIGTPPVPPGPIPPGPTPPGPTPGPAPIPADGFRVLIIEDASQRTKLAAAQQAILFSKRVADYLDAKCVMGPDGRTKEWRVWDKDTNGAADSQLWDNAMKRKRESLPWIIVSNGKAGYEGPLPASVDDVLALLQKYGG